MDYKYHGKEPFESYVRRCVENWVTEETKKGYPMPSARERYDALKETLDALREQEWKLKKAKSENKELEERYQNYIREKRAGGEPQYPFDEDEDWAFEKRKKEAERAETAIEEYRAKWKSLRIFKKDPLEEFTAYCRKQKELTDTADGRSDADWEELFKAYREKYLSGICQGAESVSIRRMSEDDLSIYTKMWRQKALWVSVMMRALDEIHGLRSDTGVFGWEQHQMHIFDQPVLYDTWYRKSLPVMSGEMSNDEYMEADIITLLGGCSNLRYDNPYLELPVLRYAFERGLGTRKSLTDEEEEEYREHTALQEIIPYFNSGYCDHTRRLEKVGYDLRKMLFAARDAGDKEAQEMVSAVIKSIDLMFTATDTFTADDPMFRYPIDIQKMNLSEQRAEGGTAYAVYLKTLDYSRACTREQFTRYMENRREVVLFIPKEWVTELPVFGDTSKRVCRISIPGGTFKTSGCGGSLICSLGEEGTAKDVSYQPKVIVEDGFYKFIYNTGKAARSFFVIRHGFELDGVKYTAKNSIDAVKFAHILWKVNHMEADLNDVYKVKIAEAYFSSEESFDGEVTYRVTFPEGAEYGGLDVSGYTVSLNSSFAYARIKGGEVWVTIANDAVNLPIEHVEKAHQTTISAKTLKEILDSCRTDTWVMEE